MDQDTLSDDIVGDVEYSLEEVYRKGVVDTWLNITNGKKKTPSGSIHVVLTFWGSETRYGKLKNGMETKYPCFPKDVNTPNYGDAERVNVSDKILGEFSLGGGGSLSGGAIESKQGKAPPAAAKVLSEFEGGGGGGGGNVAQR
jgi:hypothetical protein